MVQQPPVNAVMRKASPLYNSYFCAEVCTHHAQRPSMVENLRKAELDRVDHCTTSLTGLVYIGGSIVPFGNLGRVRCIPR
jgi:hypothetical protein